MLKAGFGRATVGLALFTLMLTGLACGEMPVSKEAQLRQTAETFAEAFAAGEWAVVHAMYPKDYKDRCPFGDFIGLITFAKVFLGIPDDMTANVESVRVEGDLGWADIRYEKDGVELDFDTDENPDRPDFAWDGSRWFPYQSPEEMSEEEPCALES